MKAVADLSRRVVIYLRVSSKSQVDTDYDPEGLSISAQREICRRKAESLGLQVVDEYVELGRSGTTVQNRPEYQAMMQRISAKRDVDYVMVYQLSRLNRNRVDDALVMLQMDAVGAKLISATENIDDSPAGQMTRGILASINQYRSASEGEDIARKLAHKARHGGTIGPAPLGYLNVKEEVDGRLVSAVAIDEERAPLIRKGFELYASGDYSLNKLARTMADLGLTTRNSRRHPNARAVSVNKWHTMLSNPYYMGMVTHKGETYSGRHDGIVDAELFATVHDILAERSAPTRRDRTHFHYLKKQLHCDRCFKAGRISKLVYTEANGAGGTYGYYFCMARKRGSCDLPYLPIGLVEEYVVRHYRTLGLPENFAALMREQIAGALADEQASLRELNESLTKRLAELDQREERLIDLAEEGLPQSKIRARLNKLREDRVRIEQDRQQSGAALQAGATLLTEDLALVRDVPGLYANALDPARGLLNDAFFKRLFVDEEGVVDTQLREPFDEIFRAAETFQPQAGAPRLVGAAQATANENSAPSPNGPRTAPTLGAGTTLSDLLGYQEVSNPRSSSKALMAED